MPTTAEGVFRIIDAASDPIKKIRNASVEMDKTVAAAGKTLDALDSPKITNSIKTTERNTKTLGQTTENMGKKVKTTTTQVGNDFERMSQKGKRSIGSLTAALKAFEHERATAQLDVDIAKAEAKIRLIKQELRTFTTAQAQKELEAVGLVATRATEALTGTAGGGGGGPPGLGGGGGGIRGGLAGGFLAAGGRAAFMATALLAAAPAVVALTGAVSALIGSLGAAAGGAGALGIGAMGAFVVGLGAIIATAKPAMNALKEVKKAQDDYNKSVMKYGRDSAQAATAQRALTQQQRRNPGAAGVVQNQRVLSQRWGRATAPARENFFGILNEGLMTANSLLPTFGRITNQVMSASRRAVADFLAPFRGGEWRNIFTVMGDTFSRISGPAARALGNIALWFGRIARAASPVVVEAFQALERWTGNLARGVSNQARTERTVRNLVEHFKDWVRLGGAAVRLMAAFFGAGAQQGQSIVEGITEQFNEWTLWLKTHPGEMEDFFARTIDSAGKLVDALGKIAKALGQIADAMLPLLNLVSTLTSALGDANLLGPLMLLGGGRLLLGRGGMGRLFGRGGAAGGGGAAAGAVAGAAGGAAAAGGIRGGIQAAITGAAANYSMRRQYGGMGRTGPMGGQGRLGAAGGAARGLGGTVLRGAGRVAGPLAAGLAAWDFATFQGNVAQRGQAALSGATLGLIPRPVTAGQLRNQGQEAAAKFMEGDPSSRRIRERMGNLREQIGGARDRGVLGLTLPGQKVGLESDAGKKIQAQLDALKPVLKAQVRVEQQNRALRQFDSMIQAFDFRWRRFGARQAGRGFIGDLRREMGRLGRDGQRTLLRATASWTATMEQGTRPQRRIAAAAKRAVVAQFRDMGQDVRVINGRIFDITAGKWNAIANAIIDPAERARQEATAAFTDTQRAARDALKNMGFSGREANRLVRDLEADRGGSGVRAETKIQRKQTQNQVDRNMGGNTPGLGGSVFGGPSGDGIGWGPESNHRDKMGGPGGRRGEMARQPQTGTVFGRGGAGLKGAKPGMSVYAQDAARFGLTVSSGIRPGSITSSGNRSFHSSGDALDLAGSSSAMMRFARHAARTYGSRLEELIYTPMGFSIKNGKRVAPYAQADHYDHVHLADTQPAGSIAGAGGMMVGPDGEPYRNVRIKRRRSRARGLFGVMSNRTTDAIATGMEKKLERAINGPGASGAGGGYNGPLNRDFGRGNTTTLSFNQVARIAEAAGLPGVTFAQIAKGESGMRPGAVSPDGGFGLWQITPRVHSPAMRQRWKQMGSFFNPWINAQMAKVLYDSGGIGQWYGTKFVTDRNAHYRPGRRGDGAGHGPIREPIWGGWHAKGGSFTAHRPTVIGVGEGGAERVNVSRLAGSGGGSRGRPPVQVHIGHITNHEEGDIEKIVDRELSKVAGKLERGPVDNEDELG